MPEQILSKRQILVAIFCICVVVLIGYHKVFTGGNFFVHQDQVLTSYFSDGNARGNGWRPDKCFGISTFYGDTITQAWSGFTFWHRLFESRETAYTASIVLLAMLSGMSFFALLKTAAPRFGPHIWLLAPLIVFCTFQPAIQYLRFGAMTVGGPLVLLFMYAFYRQPRPVHVLGLAAVLWFILMFGSIACVMTMINLSLFFTLLYWWYHREPGGQVARRYVILFTVGLGITGLLGAWIFYSHLVETLLVGYTREKVTSWPAELRFLPSLGYLVKYALSLLQVEWISQYLLDSQGVPRISYAYNAVAIFPAVFVLLLTRKAKGFWEFCFKGLIIAWLGHNLMMSIPAYAAIYSFLAVKTFLVLNIFDISVVFAAQIGLIAIFLSEYDSGAWKPGRLSFLYKGISAVLGVFYLGLLLFGLMSMFTGEFLPDLAKGVIASRAPDSLGGFPKHFLEFFAYYTLHNLQDAQHWYSLVFYATNAGLFFFFLKKDGPGLLARHRNLTALVLLINAVAMSWSVYPLNTHRLVWDEVADKLPSFQPTDRFYYAEHDSGGIKSVEDFKERLEIIKTDRGYKLFRRYGYEEYPGLKLHGHKTFTQNNVAEYLYAIFNGDGQTRITHLRNVTSGPLVSSSLLDMGAVSHYYTRIKLKNPPDFLELVFESQWLYIYKNKGAWPYFYLADRIETAGNLLENGRRLEKGTAYLLAEDQFALGKGPSQGGITLDSFSNGRVVFSFSSTREELLVVADAWHPFWRASSPHGDLPVIKANGIFKGVRLTPGNYKVTLYFDTTPFLPGAYIGALAWLFFLCAVVWGVKKEFFQKGRVA